MDAQVRVGESDEIIPQKALIEIIILPIQIIFVSLHFKNK
jgi:hypothetical protein